MPAGVEVIDYINSESCVVATTELNDNNTVNSVRDTGNITEGDSSRLDDRLPSTIAEVLKSINTLLCYVTTQENQEKAVEAIPTCERCMLLILTRRGQARSTDYFIQP